MTTKRECPVDKIETGLSDLEFAEQVQTACDECPNRAPSTVEAELREIITRLWNEEFMSPELCRKANEISDARDKEQAAKPKPASVVEPVHTEPELTPEELRECGMPETRSCENCGNSRPPAITPSDARHCDWHQSVVWRTGTCTSWKPRTPKPKSQTTGEEQLSHGELVELSRNFHRMMENDDKQTAGEGAIAISTLADVPIGAVAVLKTATMRGEWLIVGRDEHGNVYYGASVKDSGKRPCEKWYWPKDAVNRMREGK